MVDVAVQRSFVDRLLRAAPLMSRTRQEIFRRLYINGDSAQRVRQDLGIDEQQFEQERAAMLRSLMRMQ